MIGLATPIADMFPEGTFDHTHETEIIAALLILGAALVLGILAAIKPSRILGRWIEDKILDPVPMYRMLKSLVAAFLNLEDEESFKPAFLHKDDGSMEPIYVVEDRADEFSVIMSPWTPTPFAGSVKMVLTERIELVPVSLDEFSLALTHFGLGMSEVMQKRTSIPTPNPNP
jgi:uncharacterized membrane protein